MQLYKYYTQLGQGSWTKFLIENYVYFEKQFEAYGIKSNQILNGKNVHQICI